VTDPGARSAVAVLGSAPAPLVGRVRKVSTTTDHGIVIHMRNGPDLYFGGDHVLRAKWLAAARVLADPAAAGAAYVDVRVPARPAAGGL
jgi:hypothetical protein